MGFDISNHAVDVRLIREVLIPALRGNGTLDDVYARAAALGVISSRANDWGLRVSRLESDIYDKQREAAPEKKILQPKKAGFLKSLLGIKEMEEVTVWPRVPGLPGFDADLSVWGRPFFVVADNVDQALEGIERYMACDANDPAAIDAIASAMLGKLEANRHRMPRDVPKEAIQVLDAFYPLHEHLPLSEEEPSADMEARIAHLRTWFGLHQRAWAEKHTDSVIDSELFYEPTPARDLAMEAPYALINLAAQVLPGWMGRGRVWPTMLFEKIGVPVSHLFEPPAALFADLLSELPQLDERFSDTIMENYSLGGYVPPEKIGEFKSLLLRHRRDLILAWDDSKDASDADVEEQAADFIKILEPVTLAERHGYGFIEAAEVYSGFMGVMN